jgi:hypothetical protein
MTATTIKEDEAIPANYPAAPSGLSAAAAAIDPAIVWQRIEAYTARRYAARAVTWVVEGPGEWIAPLAPATVSATEIWNGAAWEAVTLSSSPLGGYILPGCGPYRVTASVGAGPVPAAVSEAFRRLAEYFAGAAQSAPAGVRQETVEGVGSIEYDLAGVARAMERSGAGDLLRPYRRAA